MNKEECLKLLHTAGKILAEEYGYTTEKDIVKEDNEKHPVTLMLEDETGEDWSSEKVWRGIDAYHQVQVRFMFANICLAVRDLTDDNRTVLAEVAYGKLFDVSAKEIGTSYHLKETMTHEQEGLGILNHMIELINSLQEQ